MITRLAAVVLVVGLLGGCQDAKEPVAAPQSSAAPASPTKAPSPAKAPPRPKNGTCYSLSYEAAVAPTSEGKPVACTSEHTTETFFVGNLNTVVSGHLLTVDSARVRNQVSSSCPAQLGDFIGGSLEDRRLSMLSALWFSPTVEQSDAGQDWYRCEVVAIGAPNELDPLVGPAKGALASSAGRDRYGMCGTDRPGTADFERIACARKHSWRAVSTIEVQPGKGGAWPGEKTARAAGQDTCSDIVRDQAGDPLKFTWGYEWPTRKQWSTGQHYGFCWAPAT